MVCTICERRPAKRWCPAKGERICAVCCGTHREVTIDCPSDCAFLQQARRYDAEHKLPLAADEIAFPDVQIAPALVREHGDVLNGIGLTALKFAREQRELTDADVNAAVTSLAEGYRTLTSGIYYEKPPQAPLPHALYAAIAAFLNEAKQQQAERAGFPALKDGDVLRLLIFFLRLAQLHSNGRSRSRAFLDWLRAQFPATPDTAAEAARIIVP